MLKDVGIRKKFSDTLEDQASKVEQTIQSLQTSLQQGSINATQYAEEANAIIVSALQVTVQKNVEARFFTSLLVVPSGLFRPTAPFLSQFCFGSEFLIHTNSHCNKYCNKWQTRHLPGAD